MRGAVPGATKGLLMVRHAELDESKLPPRVEPEAMVDEAPVQEAPLEEQTPEAEAIIEEAATAVANQPTAGAEPDESDAGPADSEKDRS